MARIKLYMLLGSYVILDDNNALKNIFFIFHIDLILILIF